MKPFYPRKRCRRSQSARCLHALLFAAAVAWPLFHPGTAHGGASSSADALFHIGRCGDTPTSPACQWNCGNVQNECADTTKACLLSSGQIHTHLKGRLAFTVDDNECNFGNQTRISLRIKPPGGTEFSIDDRLVNLCFGMPPCGCCDADAACCDQSCTIDCSSFNFECYVPGTGCFQNRSGCVHDPAFLCPGPDFISWNETVLQNGINLSLESWLFYQMIPPSMTADILSQLPSLPADAVSVIVGVREIPSGFVDGLPPNTGPSKREYCLNIWVLSLPTPGRTTIIDPPSTTDTPLSLTDMGPCGCGDGLVDLGEDCDDGDTTSGDGCDASCRREACWKCDVSQPSFCQPEQARPPLQCRRPTEAMKALLKISDKATDKGDSLKWKWPKGQATMDFGDPVTTDAYDLCIYQDAGSRPLLAGVRAPAGGTCDGQPCWSAKGNGGFKYKNKTGVPSGLAKLVLKPGADGKAKIGAKAKGAELTLPVLPLPLPVLAQLQRIGSLDCWEALYSTPDQNDLEKFDAKAD